MRKQPNIFCHFSRQISRPRAAECRGQCCQPPSLTGTEFRQLRDSNGVMKKMSSHTRRIQRSMPRLPQPMLGAEILRVPSLTNAPDNPLITKLLTVGKYESWYQNFVGTSFFPRMSNLRVVGQASAQWTTLPQSDHSMASLDRCVSNLVLEVLCRPLALFSFTPNWISVPEWPLQFTLNLISGICNEVYLFGVTKWISAN